MNQIKTDLGIPTESEIDAVGIIAAGQGLDLLDYPTLSARSLRKRLKLGSEEGVRRRIMRSRTYISARFVSAGIDGDLGKRLIENLPGSGYRLGPDLVEVRMK